MITQNDLDKEQERLIIKAKKGDDQAIERLMKKYSALVKSKARAYFLIGADNEDIIQEGMIGLYKAIKDYDHTKASNFPAFADLCVTRQILTAIKAATRQKHSPLNSYVSLNKSIKQDEETTLMDVMVKSERLNPEEWILGKEQMEILQNKMKKGLSKMEKEVLSLYLKGRDYKEIALLLNKPVKSIDNALQRIKNKVSEMLEKEKD